MPGDPVEVCCKSGKGLERNGFNRKPHATSIDTVDTEVGWMVQMFLQRTGTLDVLATESNARFGQAGVGS